MSSVIATHAIIEGRILFASGHHSSRTCPALSENMDD
jgi:hypothetical protein